MTWCCDTVQHLGNSQLRGKSYQYDTVELLENFQHFQVLIRGEEARKLVRFVRIVERR